MSLRGRDREKRGYLPSKRDAVAGNRKLGQNTPGGRPQFANGSGLCPGAP
jgi:hypothetical protein